MHNIHSCTLCPPQLLLSQFWCCSCLEGHRCLHFRGAWPGWRELLHSIEEWVKIKCWAQQIESRLVTYYLTLSLMFISAPPSMSILLISTWPSLEAKCSAVQPLVCTHSEQWFTFKSILLTHTNTNQPCLQWCLDQLSSSLMSLQRLHDHAGSPTSEQSYCPACWILVHDTSNQEHTCNYEGKEHVTSIYTWVPSKYEF